MMLTNDQLENYLVKLVDLTVDDISAFIGASVYAMACESKAAIAEKTMMMELMMICSDPNLFKAVTAFKEIFDRVVSKEHEQ